MVFIIGVHGDPQICITNFKQGSRGENFVERMKILKIAAKFTFYLACSVEFGKMFPPFLLSYDCLWTWSLLKICISWMFFLLVH